MLGLLRCEDEGARPGALQQIQLYQIDKAIALDVALKQRLARDRLLTVLNPLLSLPHIRHSFLQDEAIERQRIASSKQQYPNRFQKTVLDGAEWESVANHWRLQWVLFVVT